MPNSIRSGNFIFSDYSSLLSLRSQVPFSLNSTLRKSFPSLSVLPLFPLDRPPLFPAPALPSFCPPRPIPSPDRARMSSEVDDRCTQASGPQLGRQTCLPMDLPPAPLPASYRFPSRLWAGFLPPWSPEVTERDFFQNRLFPFIHQHLPNLSLRSTDLLEITRCKPTPEDRHAVFVSPGKLALLGTRSLCCGAVLRPPAEASPHPLPGLRLQSELVQESLTCPGILWVLQRLWGREGVRRMQKGGEEALTFLETRDLVVWQGQQQHGPLVFLAFLAD